MIPYLEQKWIVRQKNNYHSSTMEGREGGGGVEKHQMLKRMSEEKEM